MINRLIKELKKPENKKMITMGDNDGDPNKLTISFGDGEIEDLEKAVGLMRMLENEVLQDKLNHALSEFTNYLKHIQANQ